MALVSCNHALEMQRVLGEQLGRTKLQRLLKEHQLAVKAAECLLWRDRTSATIAAVQCRQAANEVSCDD